MTEDLADPVTVRIFREIEKAAELYDEYVKINAVTVSLAATEFLSAPPHQREWSRPMGIVMGYTTR